MLRTILLVTVFFLFFKTHLKSQSDTSLINEKNNLAWKLRSSNLDTSILLGNEALLLLNKITNGKNLSKNWKEKAFARTYYYLGIFYSDRGDPKLSFDYLSKALKTSTEINDAYGSAQAYGGIGSVYMNEGNRSKASEYYFKALAIHEKRGDKAGIAIQLSNLGNIFASQKLFTKALNYYTKALSLAEEMRDTARISIQLGNLGIVYYEQQNLSKALEFFFRALKITEITKNKKGIAMNLNNIASLYQSEKNYSVALDYYFKALKLAEAYKNKDHTASFIGNIGVVYTQMKEFKKAEDYLLKALRLSEEVKSMENIEEFEGALSELYSTQGKDKLALEHFKKHISARDSIFNISSAEKNVRLEMNYEFDKKQAIDNAIHQKQVLLLEAENKTQKQFRLFLFVIIGLAIGILFVLRRAYENKKRIATFLTEESQRKETLLQEVHHRINNNLQIISSLLTLQANNAGDERLFDYLQQSQSRIQSLSVLHELLYQKDSALDINMKDYLDQVLNFHRDVLSSKLHNVNMEVNVSSVQFPTKIAVPIALIINELVTNSIKYAFDEMDTGKIEVSLSASETKNNSWVLQISDNGKGMPAEITPRKESLGLRLVGLMAKQIGAAIIKNNTKGATFTLAFSNVTN